MAKEIRSRTELIGHLKQNLRFLKNSSHSFDSGYLEEAIRLAATIRVLVHDTATSTSLLKLLGTKDSMGFVDTSIPYDVKNLAPYNGLVLVRISSEGAQFQAFLSKTGELKNPTDKKVLFAKWWNAIVVKDNKSVTYSRKSLVLTLANKEGGAHVDPKIDGDFKALRESNRMGWSFAQVENGTENVHVVADVHLHSMRQIAHELIVSIENIIEAL